jgi:hypothetical protein
VSALGAAVPVRSARARAVLALALPCLAGLGALAFLGAPRLFLAVNAGALALGVLLILAARLPQTPRRHLALALMLLAVLALPLLVGPQINGVARWLDLGPLAIHSAPLCLPALVVLMAGEARARAPVLAVAAALLALQPDAAGLIALGLATGVLAALRRGLALAALAAACFVLCALTFGAGALEPQPFVEYVLADMAARSWLGAGALGLALAGGAALMATVPGPDRTPLAALAALLGGFTLAALLGPFPTPVIGYGASPILGFALALWVCLERTGLK